MDLSLHRGLPRQEGDLCYCTARRWSPVPRSWAHLGAAPVQPCGTPGAGGCWQTSLQHLSQAGRSCVFFFFPWEGETQALEFLSAPSGGMGEGWERSFVAPSPLSPHLPLKPPPEAVFQPPRACWAEDAGRREEAGMAVAAGREQKRCRRIVREAKTWAVEMC